MKSYLFRFARSPYATYFMGFAFEYLTSLMPIRRLFEDRNVIAFPHPVPFWQSHSLIVPKRAIPTFASVNFSDSEASERILHILHTAQALARKQRLNEYTVLVNGGAYQDVPQLHFHLASGIRKDGVPMYQEENITAPDGSYLSQLGNAASLEHPKPVRQFHRLLIALDQTPDMALLDFFMPEQRATLVDLLTLAQQAVKGEKLDRYTLLANVTEKELRGECLEGRLQFHLVSGDTTLV
ncbi:MAG: HIT domain-containing protein [Chloroflexota bacterium]